MKNNIASDYLAPPKFTPDNTSEDIKENHVAGINRLVKLTIFVNGEKINSYKHFKLKQSATTHHSFELTLAHDALSQRQNHQLEQANEFLGKRITVKLLYKDIKQSPERVFVGVITGVGFSQESHSLGNIVLKGFSPTILLDAAPHTQSFGGDQAVNMGIIASNVIKQGIDSSLYDVRVNAKANSQIYYSAQYDETHYNYLCRMAEAYGEQFYYDGEVLHFGNMPPQNKAIELVYGSNITDVNVELKAQHINPEYYGYNSSDNAKLTSGQTPLSHKSDLANTSYKNNQGLFKTQSLRVAPIKATTDVDVVNSQTSAAASKGVDVFTVSGATTVPFLYPGCVADLKMRKPDTNKTSYFTRVMMIEVEHEIDTLGHYSGRFTSIASDTGYLPQPNFSVPIAQPQIATVISNTDPSGQGRVQVRFDWQRHDTTNFIRMMSPDAGGTDQVTQNRGYVAIPEVGDQVMVGFVHNHPDRPFVMGGMFHGGTGLGGGANNHMRSIQTKSGIKVLMNDDEKSVTILDPSGNTWFMDGQGNIDVKAPNNMTFTVGKNFNISVGENMSTTVGKNISTGAGENITNSANENITTIAGTDIIQTATGDIKETSDTRKEFAEKDISRQSENSQSLADEIMVFSEKENMTLQSGKIVENNSSEKAKLF